MARRYGQRLVDENDDERWTHNSNFEIMPWKFASRRASILRSQCRSPRIGGCDPESPDICRLCKYRRELPGLPVFPEMIFPTNYLSVEHGCGAKIEFNPLDALRLVNTTDEPIQVAAAMEWKRSQRYLKDLPQGEIPVKPVKPFDWTYTTKYRGTVAANNNGDAFKIEETNQQIDFEKLKEKEKIDYWEESLLFEDELGDNGISRYTARIRVMKSGFLILGRFFLRVDGVLVRIYDTRYYHDMDTNYLLRETTFKEGKIADLKVSYALLKDADKLAEFVPTVEMKREKLIIPDVKLVPRKITADKLCYYHFEEGDEDLLMDFEKPIENNEEDRKNKK